MSLRLHSPSRTTWLYARDLPLESIWKWYCICAFKMVSYLRLSCDVSNLWERERGRVHLKWGAQHSISRILCKPTSHFKMANEWNEEDWGNASEILRIYHITMDLLIVTFITSSRRKLPASSPWSLRAWTFAMPPAGHLGSSPCSGWANDFQSQCQPGESYSWTHWEPPNNFEIQ